MMTALREVAVQELAIEEIEAMKGLSDNARAVAKGRLRKAKNLEEVEQLLRVTRAMAERDVPTEVPTAPTAMNAMAQSVLANASPQKTCWVYKAGES